MMTTRRIGGGRRLAAMVIALCLAVPVVAAEPSDRPGPTAEQAHFFEMKIRPLLARRCLDCHGPDTQESGLRLDSLAGMLAGGDNGPAVVPGQPEKSLLVEAVNYASLEMPPDGKLDDQEIAALTAWITMGSPCPTFRRSPPEIA